MQQRSIVDDQGTPAPSIYQQRTIDRLVAEMLGLAKGIICDGVVSDGEAVALKQWIAANPDVTASFPGNLLSQRIVGMFADGIIEDAEREELASILRDLTGELEDLTGSMNEPTALGFDDPHPSLFFDGKLYVFTGQFAFGSRRDCEQHVTDRGGRVGSAVTGKTDFVVVGALASPAWIQSTYGTKLREAIERKQEGGKVRIVPESHFLEAIQYDMH